jgi:pimeloyl-ACP methyl ester carboxylesterase
MLQYLTANGVRFAYLEEGSGPLVLLVHGFPDTPHTWSEVRPALARAGFRAVSPYTRGYFPTAVPADRRYDNVTLGRDVLAWIDALGERQAIVVGHDWGASAVYAAATLAPERVRFLVTVSIPHPSSLRPTPRLLWGARHMLLFQRRNAEAKVQADDFAHVDELVRRWSPAWSVPADETMPIKEALRHPESLSAALGYYRAISLRPPPALRARIAVPSAVFSGTDDAILRPRDYERARRWYAAPHEVIHMPGGHFLHREHPTRFIAELLRVLAPLRTTDRDAARDVADGSGSARASS